MLSIPGSTRIPPPGYFGSSGYMEHGRRQEASANRASHGDAPKGWNILCSGASLRPHSNTSTSLRKLGFSPLDVLSHHITKPKMGKTIWDLSHPFSSFLGSSLWLHMDPTSGVCFPLYVPSLSLPFVSRLCIPLFLFTPSSLEHSHFSHNLLQLPRCSFPFDHCY